MNHQFTFKVCMTDLVEGFSMAMDLSEFRHRLHSKRTAFFSVEIGKLLHIPQGDMDILYYCALLHDIGVGREGMSVENMELGTNKIAYHSEVGERISQKIPIIGEHARIIRGHHEYWNGSGGPDGLKGEEIPLLSRIIGIADFMDIKFVRYHNDVDRVFNDLEELKGKYFDPNIIDQCLPSFRKKSNYFYTILTDPHWDYHYIASKPIEMDDEGLMWIAEALAEIMDEKSPYTANHSREVARYTMMLADSYNFDYAHKFKLYIAALLHDIGKMAVPNKILHKEGVLSFEENQVIQSHPYYTEKILSKIEAFHEIIDWASLHHEKLNGKGYHKQMHGKDIPFEAKIITVADIFQALTSDRSYRKRMSDQEAFRILNEMVNKGEIDGEIVSHLASFFEYQLEA